MNDVPSLFTAEQIDNAIRAAHYRSHVGRILDENDYRPAASAAADARMSWTRA